MTKNIFNLILFVLITFSMHVLFCSCIILWNFVLFLLVSRNWIIFDISVLHNVDDPTYHVDLFSIRLYKTTTKPIFSSLAYHCSSFSSNFTYSVLNKAIIFFYYLYFILFLPKRKSRLLNQINKENLRS